VKEFNFLMRTCRDDSENKSNAENIISLDIVSVVTNVNGEIGKEVENIRDMPPQASEQTELICQKPRKTIRYLHSKLMKTSPVPAVTRLIIMKAYLDTHDLAHYGSGLKSCSGRMPSLLMYWTTQERLHYTSHVLLD